MSNERGWQAATQAGERTDSNSEAVAYYPALPMANTSRWTRVSRALEGRNYRLYVAGQLVSLIGTWTQSMAQTWLVYRLTGSTLWLGIATFCQQAPVFLLATFGGLVADRHRRRTILVSTQSSAMVLAFVLAALTLSGRVRVEHVLVLATLLGIVNAVDSPTRQAFVIDLVGRENLASAVALNASLATGATVLGPAIAGLAIQALGEGWCFVVNGVSFVAVIAGLVAMRGLPAPAAGRTRESMFARVLAGFRFAATEDRVRALLVLLAVTALLGVPSMTLMPVFASKVLHGDARTLGWLMGAQGGGALVAGLTLASRRGTEGSYRWIGGACGALGVLLVVFALSHVLWLSLAISVLLGAATLIQVSATNALMQVLTPDALRGRVMAIFTMIFSLFAPVGSVLAGSLASVYDPRRILVVGGIACTVGAIGFGLWSRSRRPEMHQRAGEVRA